ncbi:MAG: hypothetical protein Kow0010_18320 [Dehalococcoidia bacterium]
MKLVPAPLAVAVVIVAVVIGGRWPARADDPLPHTVRLPLVARDVAQPDDPEPIAWPPPADDAIVVAYPVSRATFDGTFVVFARVYNGTNTPVYNVRVDLVARDASGAIVCDRFSLARPFVMDTLAEGVVSISCDIDAAIVASFDLRVTESWEAAVDDLPIGVETHLQQGSTSADWRIDRITARNTSARDYTRAGVAVAYYDASGRAIAISEAVIPDGLPAGGEVEVDVYLYQPGSLPPIATAKVFPYAYVD